MGQIVGKFASEKKVAKGRKFSSDENTTIITKLLVNK
jgi:hypothetical protein